MASKYIASFNDRMAEFLIELVNTFPELKDMRLLKTSFTLLKNVDEFAPQKFFHMHVTVPFGDKILKRDESFFLAYDYTDVVHDIPGVTSDQSLDLVGRLKDVWHTLSPSNKEAIWNYLTVLIIISNRC
jgi:hypothetical protein